MENLDDQTKDKLDILVEKITNNEDYENVQKDIKQIITENKKTWPLKAPEEPLPKTNEPFY